ncbi:MAG: ferritin [Candidatus Omnitrophica bacterium]|nr:ferritin [Candidatus Omnitrophota bacterium]
MLSKKIEKALNDQIASENYASHYYLSMASWCDKNGLHGCAGFLYSHADQERTHMMKLFHYVNDAGAHARVTAFKESPETFKSLLDVFKLVLKNERLVSAQINRLVDICLSESDYSTFNFLQWYVAEQHEEELQFTRILDLIKITGLEGRGLFLVDKEIGAMPKKTN